MMEHVWFTDLLHGYQLIHPIWLIIWKPAPPPLCLVAAYFKGGALTFSTEALCLAAGGHLRCDSKIRKWPCKSAATQAACLHAEVCQRPYLGMSLLSYLHSTSTGKCSISFWGAWSVFKLQSYVFCHAVIPPLASPAVTLSGLVSWYFKGYHRLWIWMHGR